MKNAFFNNILKKGKENVTSIKVSPSREPVIPKKPQTNKINMSIFYKDLDFETLVPKGVQIMFMSEEELDKIAVVVVNQGEKAVRDGKFKKTISDERMYPHKKHELCSHCGLPQGLCTGHLGVVKLVVPIINMLAYKYVVSILESICLECGTLLMNPEMIKKYPKTSDRLKKIADLSRKLSCRNMECPNRDNPNPLFDKKTDNMLKIQFKKDNNQVGFITSTKIFNLFSSLQEEELEALGFSTNGIYKIHPKNLVPRVLAIIPQNHRPTAIIEGDEKVNPLTSTYYQIIKTNNILKEGIKDDRFNLEDLEANVSSILRKDTDISASGSARTLENSKNINDILGHKKGIIRNNAQGKRCNHTGRTVLGPGGIDLPFGKIRLPIRMRNLLVDEKVCDFNIDFLNELLENKEIIWIQTKDGKIKAENRIATFKLRNGMTVSRLLREGDPVLFNRNPTLYKGSLMSREVIFDNSLTIGIHSSDTAPHNADFDGDEGNIHVCPDYLSRAELKYITSVNNNIISGQFSKPLIGLVFNAITAGYLLSKYGKVSNELWNLLTSKVFKPYDSRLNTLEYRAKKRRNDNNWKNGPVLFSALLPEDFYYSRKGVVIEEGILVRGNIVKDHISSSTGSIVHVLALDYGDEIASRFIDEGQNLLDRFIERVGFTVGYLDTSMPNTEKEVKVIVEEEIEKAEKILNENSILVGSTDKEIQNFYNQNTQAALDTIKTIGREVAAKALKPDNSLKIMADCKSKGKVEDIAQLIGIVGQQFIQGHRPVMKYNKEHDDQEGLRFLPHYDILHKGRPEKIVNRGFVKTPLGKGMRPGEFFSHMMASRIGLIDTALGTAVTGYNQRKITQSLEDMRYFNNGTICSDQGQVYQYAGGYSSFDPGRMTQVKVEGYGNIWSPIDVDAIVNMLNSED